MRKPILKKFNANPWGKRIGDCVIRAIVIGLGFSYKAACKQLGVACKNGYGLIRSSGIDLFDIKRKFSPFFDVVEDFMEDQDFVPDSHKNSDDNSLIKITDDSTDEPNALGITVRDFIELYENTGQYLVGCISNNKNQEFGHILFVNCANGMNYAVDTFSSLDYYVDSFMRIRHRLPKDDPRHFRIDPVTKNLIP